MPSARLLAVLLVPLVVPAVSEAKGKPDKTPQACDAKPLPLAVGNTWTYNSIPSPLPPTDQVKRISPPTAKTVTITVTAIEKADKDTIVKLEEKVLIDRTVDAKKPLVDEYAYESTITCNDKKFDISPNSFLFAGEPGGYIGLEITKLDRTNGTSFQLTKGAVGDKPWGEDLVVLWKRKPFEGSGANLGSGKLEMERRFVPQEPEVVTTKQGDMKSEKIGLTTTGRVTLDALLVATTKPLELPAAWSSTLWYSDGVGLVQAQNPYTHMYQLVQYELK